MIVVCEMGTYLSSKVVDPMFETSHPKSIAMIDRQSATTGNGGRGRSDRE